MEVEATPMPNFPVPVRVRRFPGVPPLEVTWTALPVAEAARLTSTPIAAAELWSILKDF